MVDQNESFETLKKLFGREIALKIADAFAGTTLYIPKGVMIRERHNAIREEYHEGATYRELSIRYGYTVSHIRNIIHGEEKKDCEKT